MTTRKGKIGRLPFDFREELNHRLLKNEPVKDILHWLGIHPTVRLYMSRLFEGRPITEQNISEWRQGGYQEWLAYRSCIENVRDVAENAARIALTDITAEHLLLSLTATFAELMQGWSGMEETAFNRKLIVLQDLIKMALSMRRSEQKDERLRLDRERLEILRAKKGDRSLSSCPPSPYETRASSFSSVRPSAAHPLHPKAPELRRPPAPIDPNLYFDDPDWPPSPFECDRSDPSPDDPSEVAAGPDGPSAPAPSESPKMSSE